MNVSPLNESGQAVDWWFIYKVPKLSGGNNTAGATGYEYAYYDDPLSSVVKSPYTLNSQQGALHHTLDALFSAPSPTTGWLFYNDEKPASAAGTDDSELGHTKGVIAFDLATDSALWLLHSWPKYVDPGTTAMPTPLYGQTFLCLALDLAATRALAAQMLTHQQPQVYEPRLPEGLAADDPLRLLTQTIDPNDPGEASTLSLTSRGGTAFEVIAKNRDWGKDFWNDLVGPKLGEDINVDTWIRGKSQIPPMLDSDGIHKTFDIKYITLREIGLPWAWPETRDHAKWAISYKDNWVCVGDISRMISQEKRGGCTIAFQNAALCDLLNKTDLLAPPQHHRSGCP
ncbi:deoxyribonuclease II family protein [Crenobacter sp. SG2303]|uniref:Deoxyribonuclease II family protein n=1 Tax=Crenobacter oryzisoli TaxID=3056844 RepID=A0ABT7XMS0_9NEIS|nr:deoxyribonuclease II family protein [Crenobacter sp. SG2303]MDN0075075.1 deoxyribonuclease II family protein [Crenobacter sp. SG2303]